MRFLPSLFPSPSSCSSFLSNQPLLLPTISLVLGIESKTSRTASQCSAAEPCPTPTPRRRRHPAVLNFKHRRLKVTLKPGSVQQTQLPKPLGWVPDVCIPTSPLATPHALEMFSLGSLHSVMLTYAILTDRVEGAGVLEQSSVQRTASAQTLQEPTKTSGPESSAIVAEVAGTFPKERRNGTQAHPLRQSQDHSHMARRPSQS